MKVGSFRTDRSQACAGQQGIFCNGELCKQFNHAGGEEGQQGVVSPQDPNRTFTSVFAVCRAAPQ